jgi:DNA-binding MarR family transcriptional regulator
VAFYTSTIGLSDGQEYVRMVGGYILAHQLEQITLRDIDRGIRAMRHMDQQEQLRIMDHLEAFGWVERSDKRHDAKRWIVLPAVHETYAQIAENERRKRANIRATINEIGSTCDD